MVSPGIVGEKPAATGFGSPAPTWRSARPRTGSDSNKLNLGRENQLLKIFKIAAFEHDSNCTRHLTCMSLIQLIHTKEKPAWSSHICFPEPFLTKLRFICWAKKSIYELNIPEVCLKMWPLCLKLCWLFCLDVWAWVTWVGRRYHGQGWLRAAESVTPHPHLLPSYCCWQTHSKQRWQMRQPRPFHDLKEGMFSIIILTWSPLRYLTAKYEELQKKTHEFMRGFIGSLIWFTRKGWFLWWVAPSGTRCRSSSSS